MVLSLPPLMAQLNCEPLSDAARPTQLSIPLSISLPSS